MITGKIIFGLLIFAYLGYVIVKWIDDETQTWRNKP